MKTTHDDAVVRAHRRARQAIAEVRDAAENYALHVHQEHEVQMESALRKQDAILRLMKTTNPLSGEQEKLHSASSAEKVVEGDAEYRTWLETVKHRAYADTVRARGRYDAAKLAAELAVAVFQSASTPGGVGHDELRQME